MTDTGPPNLTSEPRTISGRAWLSGMRPHHRRAATPLILSIEREAATPAMEALRVADAVLADIAEIDPARPNAEAFRRLIGRARAAHEPIEPLLASD